VRARLSNVIPLLQDEIKTLEQNDGALTTEAKALLDGNWPAKPDESDETSEGESETSPQPRKIDWPTTFRTAESALETFKAVRPKVKYHKDPEGTKAIERAAQKVVSDTAHIRKDLVRFTELAPEFLIKVGGGALKSSELSQKRKEIRRQYDVVLQLLRVEQEWLGVPTTTGQPEFRERVRALDSSLGPLLKHNLEKLKSPEPSSKTSDGTDAPVPIVSKPVEKVEGGVPKPRTLPLVKQQLSKNVPLSDLVTKRGMISAKQLKALSTTELDDLALSAGMTSDKFFELVKALPD
jgi:hypothetical protein